MKMKVAMIAMAMIPSTIALHASALTTPETSTIGSETSITASETPLVVSPPLTERGTGPDARIAFDPKLLVNRRTAIYCLTPFMMEEARNMVRMLQPELLSLVGCGVMPPNTKVRWTSEIGTELSQVMAAFKDADGKIEQLHVWVKTDDFKNELEWAQHDVCDPLDVVCLKDVADKFRVDASPTD